MRKATHLNGSGTGWVGPYQISSYLGNAVRDADAQPPEASGLYIVSQRPWSGMPDVNAGLIYVGRAAYIRYRIGQLLCEMCGFTSETTEDEAYGHRGGHAIWHGYCLPRNVEPLSLYIAWCSEGQCLDCAEMKLAPMLTVRLDVMPIHPCSRHRPPLDLAENCSRRAQAFSPRRPRI